MTDRMTWRDSALAWSTDDPDEMHTDPELAVDREMTTLTTNQTLHMTIPPTDPEINLSSARAELDELRGRIELIEHFFKKYRHLFRRLTCIQAFKLTPSVTFYDSEPVYTLGREGWDENVESGMASYSKVVNGVEVRLFRIRAVETPEPKVVSL